ncbi:MAG TPA: PQQ-binding-like beta-propeller repeat protein [Vicinamibacterales bacterium]|nr:PQQ-binding-like beta-propeller repeat protein [Vicinamibacterales bacterium]
MSSKAFALSMALSAALSATLSAQWAQWRGEARDGVVPAAVVPKAWPEALTEGWAAEVGEGYSTPVVAGGRVFVHARRDPDEIVTAFDLATGKPLWSDTHRAPFTKNQYASAMAKGPNATPLAAGGRLYTFGVTAVLTAYDAATGKVLWRHDYTKDIDSSKLFCGTAMSPILVDGNLLVHVGDDRGGVFRAFDGATGALKWEQKGPGPGYASPVLATIDGEKQIVTMTDKSVVGVSTATGTTLWSFPFPDEWNENIVTPVIAGNTIVVSGTRRGTYGLAVGRDGASWTVVERWQSPETAMYMSSPVLHDGVLYGMSSRRKGQFFALDPATGKTLWMTEGREAGNAHLVVAGSELVAQLDSGEMIVAPASKTGFKAGHRYTVGKSATYTHPVLVPGGVLVRDQTHLRFWRY